MLKYIDAQKLIELKFNIVLQPRISNKAFFSTLQVPKDRRMY